MQAWGGGSSSPDRIQLVVLGLEVRGGEGGLFLVGRSGTPPHQRRPQIPAERRRASVFNDRVILG